MNKKSRIYIAGHNGMVGSAINDSLQSKGYRIIPVNPTISGTKLLGENVYANLKDIPEKIEGIEVLEPVYTDFRKGDVRHSLANIIKAQDLLNYVPAYEVSQGINETIKWYIKEFRK